MKKEILGKGGSGGASSGRRGSARGRMSAAKRSTGRGGGGVTLFTSYGRGGRPSFRATGGTAKQRRTAVGYARRASR